jgi:chorismate mutase / prephenate dehydratase
VSLGPAGGARAADDPLVGELRTQINHVDRELLAALNRRLEIVRRLHDHKQASGLPLRDAEREASLLAELAAANAGPLSQRGVSEFFEHVLELTRRELHGA